MWVLGLQLGSLERTERWLLTLSHLSSPYLYNTTFYKFTSLKYENTFIVLIIWSRHVKVLAIASLENACLNC